MKRKIRNKKQRLSASSHYCFIFHFTAGSAAEKGYFGPWRQCKLLLYGRERCGQGVSRFQPVCELISPIFTTSNLLQQLYKSPPISNKLKFF